MAIFSVVTRNTTINIYQIQAHTVCASSGYNRAVNTHVTSTCVLIALKICLFVPCKHTAISIQDFISKPVRILTKDLYSIVGGGNYLVASSSREYTRKETRNSDG